MVDVGEAVLGIGSSTTCNDNDTVESQHACADGAGATEGSPKLAVAGGVLTGENKLATSNKDRMYNVH